MRVRSNAFQTIGSKILGQINVRHARRRCNSFSGDTGRHRPCDNVICRYYMIMCDMYNKHITLFITLHNNNSTAHSRHCVVFSMLHVSICPVVASVALSVQTPQYTCPRVPRVHRQPRVAPGDHHLWHRVITICRRAASRLGCSPGGRRRPPRRHRLVGPRMRSEAHLQLHHAVVRVSEQPDAL